jgi:hypothetical protein
MKRILILLVTISFLISCDTTETDYSKTSEKEINNLKSPVILIGKTEDLGQYSIAVRDSTNKILTIGNLSIVARIIGQSRKIGDTIR